MEQLSLLNHEILNLFSNHEVISGVILGGHVNILFPINFSINDFSINEWFLPESHFTRGVQNGDFPTSVIPLFMY